MEEAEDFTDPLATLDNYPTEPVEVEIAQIA